MMMVVMSDFGWSALISRLVGDLGLDSAATLNYRPRLLYPNSRQSSSRLPPRYPCGG